MMFKQTLLASTLLALSGLVAAQTPAPACVLACVNEASNPSIYSEICETKVKDTWTCLKSACSTENYKVASEHVQAVCKGQGITVDMKKAVPATSTKTGSGSEKTGTPEADEKEEKEEEEEEDKDSGAVKIGGSFGALAIALTVMGAMSF